MKITNALWLMVLLCGVVSADEASDAGKAAKAESATLTVSGVFEAVESVELKAGTEELTSLKIKKIVPHGTMVKSGQTVVAFDAEQVDEKLEEAEQSLKSAIITFSSEEFAMQQFVETQKLDRAAADRAWASAQQSFDNFQQTDRDRLIKSAEFSLKSSEASLANAMEELKQLEQMYKEDELTEESEEIVLKRAKQSVDSALFRLEGTKISTQRTIEQTVPVRVAEEQSKLRRAELTHERAMHDLEAAAEKKELDMAGKVKAFKKKKESFETLRKERRELTLAAPFDGIVYYGALTRGRMSDKPSTLKVDSTVTAEQVIATVLNPDQLQIRTTLTEAQVSLVKAGQTAKVTAAVSGDKQMTATVKSVSRIPYANNKFDCVLSLEGAAGVVPATGCQIKITLP